MSKALIVEDNKSLLRLYRAHFKNTGIYVKTLEEAYRCVDSEDSEVGCAIVDLCLGGKTSLDFIDYLKSKVPSIIVYIVTGFSVKAALPVIGISDKNLFIKPVDMKKLKQEIESKCSLV